MANECIWTQEKCLFSTRLGLLRPFFNLRLFIKFMYKYLIVNTYPTLNVQIFLCHSWIHWTDYRSALPICVAAVIVVCRGCFVDNFLLQVCVLSPHKNTKIPNYNALEAMENILNSNYDDGDDSYTSFDQPKASGIKRERSTTSSKSDLFGDDDASDDGMDDQEYQDAAQEIEDNLIKDIKRERVASGSGGDAAGGFDDNSSNGSSSNHTGGGGGGASASSSTQHRELKQSSSFEQDMAFPALGRYSENERERQKRKELKTKKEIEEEEREKMQ